jgi:hypothetical protein
MLPTILDLATLKALYAERKVTPRDAMQAVIDRSAAGVGDYIKRCLPR